MVGIDEVARAAGVSTATVSRALSGRGRVSPATRARVEQAQGVKLEPEVLLYGKQWKDVL